MTANQLNLYFYYDIHPLDADEQIDDSTLNQYLKKFKSEITNIFD